jgi:hypothetical protein
MIVPLRHGRSAHRPRNLPKPIIHRVVATGAVASVKSVVEDNEARNGGRSRKECLQSNGTAKLCGAVHQASERASGLAVFRGCLCSTTQDDRAGQPAALVAWRNVADIMWVTAGELSKPPGSRPLSR